MRSVGVIGCGFIGRKRAESALALGLSVPVVADIDGSRAQALAGFTKGTAVGDWRAVVGSAVEIVIVAVTHDHLAPIAIAALEQGKHVLVEKPCGRSLRDATAVHQAAQRCGRLVKAGFNHRFHPALQKAKEIASAGQVGPLMFIRGRYGHGGRIGYEREWRFMTEKSGGGELVDQGSHLIDLSRWFLGDLELAYAATPTYYWDTAVEDNCFLALKSQDGKIAWLHASWSEWKNTFSFEIYGKTGKLHIEGLGGSYGVERLTYYKMLPQMGPPETTAWEYPFPDASWRAELQEFLSAIDAGREPVGSSADARAVWEVIENAYRRS